MEASSKRQEDPLAVSSSHCVKKRLWKGKSRDGETRTLKRSGSNHKLLKEEADWILCPRDDAQGAG